MFSRGCCCQLKDWRGIATRYDKLARNFLAALCFVALPAYWFFDLIQTLGTRPYL